MSSFFGKRNGRASSLPGYRSHHIDSTPIPNISTPKRLFKRLAPNYDHTENLEMTARLLAVEQLILQPNMRLPQAICKIMVTQTDAVQSTVSQALVYIFEKKDNNASLSSTLVKSAVTNELSAVSKKDTKTLGGFFFKNLFNHFCKVQGLFYVHHILSEELAHILASIDASRSDSLVSLQNVDKRQDNSDLNVGNKFLVLIWAERILKRIHDSITLAPMPIRDVLLHIHESLIESGVKKKEAKRRVAQLLFTELFIPALKMPNFYGLLSDLSSVRLRSVLSLVSHLLLACVTPNYTWDRSTVEIDRFVKEKSQIVKDIAYKLLTVPEHLRDTRRIIVPTYIRVIAIEKILEVIKHHDSELRQLLPSRLMNTLADVQDESTLLWQQDSGTEEEADAAKPLDLEHLYMNTDRGWLRRQAWVTDHKLKYNTFKDGKMVEQYYDLRDYEVHPAQTRSQPFAIVLRNSKKFLLVAANSDVERKAWLQILQIASQANRLKKQNSKKLFNSKIVSHISTITNLPGGDEEEVASNTGQNEGTKYGSYYDVNKNDSESQELTLLTKHLLARATELNRLLEQEKNKSRDKINALTNQLETERRAKTSSTKKFVSESIASVKAGLRKSEKPVRRGQTPRQPNFNPRVELNEVDKKRQQLDQDMLGIRERELEIEAREHKLHEEESKLKILEREQSHTSEDVVQQRQKLRVLEAKLSSERAELAIKRRKLERDEAKLQAIMQQQRKRLQARLEEVKLREDEVTLQKSRLQGEREMLEKFISRHNREIVDDKTLRLRKAIQAKQTKKIEKLLLDGANPKDKDELGATMLHYAAKGGRLDIINLLLYKNGYFPPFASLKDKSGKTPYDWALESKKPSDDILTLLKEKEDQELKDASKLEDNLVQDLYEQEVAYRHIYNTVMTSNVNRVSKKYIKEVYSRYQDMYHPLLMTTSLFNGKKFDFDAYKHDGSEHMRLQKEEKKFAEKAKKISNIDIANFHRTRVLPLTTLAEALQRPDFLLSSEMVRSIIKDVGSPSLSIIFSTRINSATLESAMRRLKRKGNEKSRTKVVQALERALNSLEEEMIGLKAVRDFYNESSKRAVRFHDMLEFTSSKLARLSSQAVDTERRIQKKDRIRQLVVDIFLHDKKEVKLHTNTISLKNVMTSILCKDDKVSEALFHPQAKTRLESLKKSINDAVKQFIEVENGFVKVVNEYQVLRIAASKRREVMAQYSAAISSGLAKWKTV